MKSGKPARSNHVGQASRLPVSGASRPRGLPLTFILTKQPRSMELRKTFQFEAAHLLPHLPASHKCRRLHGHSFMIEVAVEGPCDPQLGWVMDYAEIGDAVRPIWEKLDHF